MSCVTHLESRAMVRSDFCWHRPFESLPRLLAVIDANLGACSVTNDVENVVAYLHRRKLLSPGDRLVYRDSTGFWDEIRHADGKFVAFAPIRARQLSTVRALLEGDLTEYAAPC